jgi:UDP-glucose 4-epimerase
MVMPRVLVTGGAGYIGAHICLVLLEAGYDVVVVDDFSNSHPEALRRVRELARADDARLAVVRGSIRDRDVLDDAFGRAPVDAVVHLAGLKAVGESVAEPLRYYETNLAGTMELAEAMKRHGVRDLVFSSSCTVYGEPDHMPITEATPLGARSPYGRTKQFIEAMLQDMAAAGGWRIILLRYFNPVGAHGSGRIGEDPIGIPDNLMPFVMQVAIGRRDKLTVFGGDYATPDGTAIRDYLHVVDLATAHVAALEALEACDGAVALNLGTGRGYSVLDVVTAASDVVGFEIPYEIGPRRAGDVAAVWSDPSAARVRLGWQASRDLRAMCEDHWRWQQANPDGYRGGDDGSAQDV